MKGRKNAVKLADAVLCYVDFSGAYFTTQELSKQWGDDWNDAPYEHNAGVPYKPCWHNESEHVAKRGSLCKCSCCIKDWNEDGTPKWQIVFVKYCGGFQTPADLNSQNSHFSVEEINAGGTPWLVSDTSEVQINAGTSLKDFIETLRKCGGAVQRVRLV